MLQAFYDLNLFKIAILTYLFFLKLTNALLFIIFIATNYAIARLIYTLLSMNTGFVYI